MAPSFSFNRILGLCLAFCTPLIHARAVVHDSSFQPDIILRAHRVDSKIACVSRPSVVINGTAPGPLVKLREGKTSWIRVYNDMHDANFTIHWHGLSQSVAPFSDGTPLASQWPIAPMHYFDYELRPNVGEAGTYFYHSHVQFQAVTASGPLVVEEQDSTPPYKYDENRILYVTELYKPNDSTIVSGLQAIPFVWSGEPATILLNGHSAGNKTVSTKECGPEVIEVEPDKTYRFRFIGGVALSDIAMAIQGHRELTIIEADGSYTKPHVVHHMQVDSGQRFDVLLRTKSEAELKKEGKRDFWIQMSNQYRPTVVTAFGLLRYTKSCSCHGFSCYKPGSSISTPPGIPRIPAKKIINTPRFDNNWLEYALEPLKPNNFPSASEVTRRVYLNNVQVELQNQKVQFLVNNHSWVAESPGHNYLTSPTAYPYLVSVYEHGQKAIPSVTRAQQADNYGRDPDFNAYPAQVGEVIEIILTNEAGFANTFDVHPWHAHGGHYYDIGSGRGIYDPKKNEEKLKGYNPVLRDTTMLYRFPADNIVNDTEYSLHGWRAWRLRVEDAGVWMIHCHTLQHMIMGMQTVWVMGNAAQIKAPGLPPMSNFDVYGKNDKGSMQGYMTYKGAAYGNSTHSPVVNHHFPERED